MKDADGELLYPPRMKQAMAFHRIKKKLQREYLGKWVIIHSSQHVGGGYDNSQSAYAAAEDMGLKIQECLIMRVVAGDTAFRLVWCNTMFLRNRCWHTGLTFG